MDKTMIAERLEFHRSAASKLMAAYIALVEGGVSQYTIGSRSLTKWDIEKIRKEIDEHDKKAAEYEALLNGGARRKAIGVIPRDW